MISHISGTVAAIGPTSVVIDVSGVGLEAYCTARTLAGLHVGREVTLSTTLVVREDSLTLFGFADAEERDMFLVLQSATGVGPKLAQSYLSVLAPDELRTAVANEDHAALTRVPGVGKKGAQRLVVELKDKITALGPARTSSGLTGGSVGGWRDQVVAGLQGLGWSAREAEAAADGVAGLAADDPQVSVATLMRAALQSLGRNK